MKLTVLGSGSGLSNAERFPAGYLVEGTHAIVLDLGFGCFKQLQKAIEPNKVNAIFFSHYAHPDHVADLIAFLFYRKLSGNKNQLNLYGPNGFKKFFPKVINLFDWFKELPFKVSLNELRYSSINLFDFSIKTKPVKHMDSEAIAFRIESGNNSIAYSGDTEYCDEIIDLAKESNLLILECSSLKKTPGHLTPEECLKIAKQANAKKLLLSHFYPETESVKISELGEGFNGKILLARDLMELEICSI